MCSAIAAGMLRESKYTRVNCREIYRGKFFRVEFISSQHEMIFERRIMNTLKTYTVESRAFQWGKWTEWTNEGEFHAPTNQGAKAQARAKIVRGGWTRQDGKLELRARLAA